MEAYGGEEGLDLYRRKGVDLVITDVFMPEINGLEVIKELRRDYTDAKIIAIAARGKEALDMAEEAGADRVLSKPFGKQDLSNTVDELLKES